MKKSIIFCVSMLFLCYFASAQNNVFEFLGSNNAKLADTAIYDEISEDGIKIYLKIKNVSSEDKDASIIGRKVGSFSGLISYCYPGGCNVPPAPIPPQSVPAGTIYQNDALYIEYIPTENGSFYANFIAYDPNDSINTVAEQIFRFDVRSVNSIKNTGKAEFSLEVYPNPASNVLKIKSDLSKIQSSENILVIRNMVGSVVKTIPLNTSLTEVSVADLSSGMYFYSLSIDGILQNTKKLIIKR